MNSAPVTGALDAQTFRNVAKAQSPMVVNIRTEMRERTQDLSDFFGGGGAAPDDLLERFFGQPREPRRHRAQPRPAARRSASGARRPPAPASSSARTASSSPTTTSSRTPTKIKVVALRRGRRSGVRRQADRPRPAHRQRADSADREAEPAAAGGEVRRLVADGRRRLGHGDRQSVQPGLDGHRRRHQRDRARRSRSPTAARAR